MQRNDLVHIAINFLLFSSCFIDDANCEKGLQGLHDFDYSNRRTHSASTFSTDCADSFCYMASSVRTKNQRLSNALSNPTNSSAIVTRGLIKSVGNITLKFFIIM